MKRYLTSAFYLIMCLSMLSCIEDATLDEFSFSEKLLIMGYAGTHDEPARVNVFRSVPVDS